LEVPLISDPKYKEDTYKKYFEPMALTIQGGISTVEDD
jgi:hypothetical protein